MTSYHLEESSCITYGARARKGNNIVYNSRGWGRRRRLFLSFFFLSLSLTTSVCIFHDINSSVSECPATLITRIQQNDTAFSPIVARFPENRIPVRYRVITYSQRLPE